MRKIRNSLCLLAMIFASCISKKAEFGVATDYFPSADLLTDGVVNKYYEHYTYSNDQAPLTIILYIKYHLISSRRLEETQYGGGFNPILKRIYRFDSSRQVLEDEKFYFDSDTLSTEIIENVRYSWASQQASLEGIRHYPKGDFKIRINQKNLKDETLVEGLSTKRFESEIITDWKNGVQKININSKAVYAQNLGLFFRVTERENVSIRTELIEQMPLSEFQKRKDHGIKRVGYIDTTKILDDNTITSHLCGPFSDLADYYNSNPDGGYLRNKNNLEKELRSSIDENKLNKESGYLTFRFIVNCKGVAGLFVAEGVDENYQFKEFSKPVVDHFYQALKSLGRWRSVVLNGESQDAHFYITFKLKDGKITDILP